MSNLAVETQTAPAAGTLPTTPRKRETSKGTPPTKVTKSAVLGIVDAEAKQFINISTTQSKRLEIMQYAKERGLTMGKMLILAFDEYKATH